MRQLSAKIIYLLHHFTGFMSFHIIHRNPQTHLNSITQTHKSPVILCGEALIYSADSFTSLPTSPPNCKTYTHTHTHTHLRTRVQCSRWVCQLHMAITSCKLVDQCIGLQTLLGTNAWCMLTDLAGRPPCEV